MLEGWLDYHRAMLLATCAVREPPALAYPPQWLDRHDDQRCKERGEADRDIRGDRVARGDRDA